MASSSAFPGLVQLKIHLTPTRFLVLSYRNCFSCAAGDVLVFIDADVAVPPTLLHAIYETMSEPSCIGGGVDVDYRLRQPAVRLYLRAWRILGRLTGMVQGATQFCRKRVFEQVGGYDENAWIGEDVDFYRSLRRLARDEHHTVRFIREPRVQPSCRRFDKWPLWRVLIWTNPLFIAVFRRWRAVWTRLGLAFASGTVDHEENRGTSSSPPHSAVQPGPVHVV